MSTLTPLLIVVMGVSGCGKSTVGQLLAQRLQLPFVEGDDLHSADNVARMAAGVPLSDADRHDWLLALAQRLRQARSRSEGLVMSCSALKRSYRDMLREGSGELHLLHLSGDADLLEQRLSRRAGHYMPASLLPSQLAILEPPQADEHAVVCDVALTPAQIVASALQQWQAPAPMELRP